MIGFLFNMGVLGAGLRTSATFQQGSMIALGMTPESGLSYSGLGSSAAPTHRTSYAGFETIRNSKTGQGVGQRYAMKAGVNASRFATAVPLLFSGYFVYKGFQEDGVKGASDALIYDAAVGLATASSQKSYLEQSQYARGLGRLTTGERAAAKQAGLILNELDPKQALTFTRTKMKMLSFVGKGMGAGIGASVGQAVGGTPGAFAGAFLAAKVPLPVTLGLAAAGTAATMGVQKVISKGTTILKKGYERRAFRRRIDTAGDTAAFFTRNANTMRSRSVLSMRNSHLNARSALGMEASMTHMNRDYFSKYG